MPRILLIDDDENVRTVLALTLKSKGYEVVQAENGRVGVRKFRESPTDLVITDLIMPEKEGLETIQDIRREFPGTRIIAMSGGSPNMRFDFLQIAQAMGALRTLQKPFTMEEFISNVREVLGES